MNIFKELFHLDKNLYWFAVLCTTISVAVFIAISKIFYLLIGTVTSKIATMLGSIDLATVSKTTIENSSAVPWLWLVFLMLLIFIIIEVYSLSFFEILIWNRIAKQKTTFKNTSKFLVFNIFVLLILGIINFAFIGSASNTIGIVSDILVVIVVFLSFYILFVSYYVFAKTQRLFHSIKESFVVGIKHMRKTIIVLIAAIIIMLILDAILFLLGFLSSLVMGIIQGMLFILFISWFRVAIANALKSIKV